MTRDGRRPPTTRYGWIRLEHRTDAAKPPTDPAPAGPKDGRPPRGPVQPSRPNPRDPDSLPDPRPGRVLAVIVGLLLLARHPPPAGEPLGHRRDRPHHPDGWTVTRDQPAEPAWEGGKRPPLKDNLNGAKP